MSTELDVIGGGGVGGYDQGVCLPFGLQYVVQYFLDILVYWGADPGLLMALEVALAKDETEGPTGCWVV